MKSISKYIRLLPLIFFIADACIEPFPLVVTGSESRLVINGLLTQGAGPHQVQLVYSAAPGDLSKKTIYEQNAIVRIIDDEGHETLLKEFKPGTYRTENFTTETGRSYRLEVTTKAGKKYGTNPQTLLPATTISNAYVEFQSDVLNGGEIDMPHDAFGLYVDGKGNENVNLLRWKWTGIYVARSYPELHDTIYPRGRNPVPNPLPCSGYIWTGTSLAKVGECTCCICYSTEYSPSATVSKNEFNLQETFNKVSLGRISVSAMHFYERYYVEVEQLSIGREAYDFWRLVEAQQQGAGSIFQPSSVRIKGNVTCVTNPDETVLGFFEVAGVTRKGFFIDASVIPYDVPDIGMIGDDCRKIFNNPTTTKPDFW